MAEEAVALNMHSCSKLNFHLFSLYVVDSPACPCGHDREDSNHYLLRCPLFYQARNMLLNEIRELTMTDISCELLLYGSSLSKDYILFPYVMNFNDYYLQLSCFLIAFLPTNTF